MDEATWNASTNPADMLTHLRPSGLSGTASRVSDRQLRLWAVACCDRYGVERDLDPERDKIGSDLDWALAWARIGKQGDGWIWNYKSQRSEPDERAAILRDIVPYRPLALGEYVCKYCRRPVSPWYSHGHGVLWAACSHCRISLPTDDGFVFVPPPWLTPRVVAFAGRVYEGRDFAALAVLPDLLLEEGMPETVACAACEGRGAWDPESGEDWYPCRPCNGRGTIPHPLLQHFRQGAGNVAAVHVRGCAWLDALRGVVP